MAIGAVARGDLVVAHSTVHNIHGLFVVDSVSGNDVYLFPPDADSAVAGRNKASNLHIQKSDILAVHTASSVSA
jgi:hypothetical protein